MTDKPWATQRPQGEVRRYKSRGEAVESIRSDLDSLWDSFVTTLNDPDAADAISELRRELDLLPATGGRISGVCDPYTGMKYSVDLWKDEL